MLGEGNVRKLGGPVDDLGERGQHDELLALLHTVAMVALVPSFVWRVASLAWGIERVEKGHVAAERRAGTVFGCAALWRELCGAACPGGCAPWSEQPHVEGVHNVAQVQPRRTVLGVPPGTEVLLVQPVVVWREVAEVCFETSRGLHIMIGCHPFRRDLGPQLGCRASFWARKVVRNARRDCTYTRARTHTHAHAHAHTHAHAHAHTHATHTVRWTSIVSRLECGA